MDITYECAECGLVILIMPMDTPPKGWEYIEDPFGNWYWLCPKCANA